MIYAFQLYYFICTLFLSGKDADSQQLKDKKDNALSIKRVNRWHRDGLALAILFVVPLMDRPEVGWWKTCVACLLIRLSFFDLAFNKWASLDVRYLGGTAWTDRVFVRIFGQYGAVRKSFTFFIIWVALNLLNQFL